VVGVSEEGDGECEGVNKVSFRLCLPLRICCICFADNSSSFPKL
jgi:hypothetical protein